MVLRARRSAIIIIFCAQPGASAVFPNDGVVSSQTLHFRTNLAAEFFRRCSFLISLAGSPYNKLLQ